MRLDWSIDETGSQDRLAQVLRRERLMDTSLDYGLDGLGKGGATPAQTQAEREDLARAYGARRGVSMPVSEIVVSAAERMAAGWAGFRDRYEAHQQQRKQAAERDQQVHGLGSGLITRS